MKGRFIQHDVTIMIINIYHIISHDIAGRTLLSHFILHYLMPRNMVIWASEVPSEIWSPTVRVGDIGGQLGGSGKNRVTVSVERS